MTLVLDHGLYSVFERSETMIERRFLKYVIPSMISMLFGGLYSLIDGLFVGNVLGDVGLAGINLSYPLQVVINATAIGIGIGGSVLCSAYKGEKNEERENAVHNLTIMTLFVIGIILPLLLLLSKDTLLGFLGAEGEIGKQANIYITTLLYGGIFLMLGNGINPLIRNLGYTKLATFNMCSGLITNIVLDYFLIFKFHMGMSGAALATMLAQAVVAILNVGSILYLRGLKIPQKKYVVELKKIIQIGIAPFGQTLIPSLLIVFTNLACIKYGGDRALATYSLISYVLSSVQLLLQGIGDGAQPLFSYYHGAKEEENLNRVYNLAFFSSIALAFLLFICTNLYAVNIVKVFGASEGLIDEAVSALRLTSFSYLFYGIIRATSAFLYATQKNKFASILIYLEPCVLAPICLFLFPSLFGMQGVWVTYPIMQVILCVIALVFKSPNLINKKEDLKNAATV